MSTLRERLAALRARRDSHPATTNALPTEISKPRDAEQVRTPPRPPGSKHTQAIRVEWRVRAMKAAKDRVKRAALDSGVYDVITRPLPREKDDIEELEKRRREELAEQADDAEDEDDDDDEEDDDDDEEDAEPGDEVDEEEAALLGLNRGEDTRDDTRDADTRDADTRDADTRDADTRDADTRDADTRDADTRDDTGDGADTRDGAEHTRDTEGGHEREEEGVRVEQGNDDASTLPDGEQPESAPIDKKRHEEETETVDQVKKGESDDPSPQEPKPVLISETGPEIGSEENPKDTPPETPEQTPVKVVPSDVTPPRNPLGMVEDEAADDEDDEVENHSPDLSGDEVDNIVPDADVGEQEAVKLAEFHRKWEAEQMEPAAPRYDDLDEAMDFTDVKVASDEPVEGISAESGVAADEDRADNYINAMFLREDSKSRVVNVDEDDDVGDETTREKARALWKARQKFRTELRERDESNSLSRFDLFSDTKNRSADIRSRLEKSCRPAPLREVTNVDKSKKRKREQPEWARRKETLAQKERKRLRAVSVGNWSFAMHGKREKAEVKKSSARPSLGAAHLTKRSRTRKAATPPRARPPAASVSRRSKGATSFKGLLSVLGNQASVEHNK